MATEFARFQMLFGTTAEWSANSSFVALVGEFMVDTDTNQVKIGDGVSTYAALPFVGSGLGVNFATSAEVLAGLLTNVAVAPDTLLANYPQKAAGANPQSISADWSLNASNTLAGRTTITLQPRTGASGVNDAMPRSYVDGLFSGAISAGAGDAGKAPILDSSGKLDTSFIPTENLPGYRGLFNPVTGSPALQDTSGGGVTPVAISGDYFIAEDSGFYNFATGTPGAGTTVNEGAQVIFNDTTNAWAVVDPSGTNFDPGAVRLAPANASQTTITPGGVGVPNLTLQQIALQTADILRLLDSGGTPVTRVDTVGTITSYSIDVALSAPTTTADLTSYPQGISTSAVTVAAGWPLDGQVITVKESGTVAYQILSRADDLYLRAFTGSWSSFWRIASTESPTFTGTVSAPTPTAGTNNTQVATTAFVVTENEYPGLIQGRLSPATTPLPYVVSTSSTLYYYPYNGNLVTLFDTTTSSWIKRTITPLSTSPIGGADSVHDVFLFWTGSALALEIVGWTNDTTRATNLVTQDDVLVKDGELNKRYIGTYRTDGSGNLNTQTSTTKNLAVAADRKWDWLLYNHYNQIEVHVNIKMVNGGADSTSITNTLWDSIGGIDAGFRLINGNFHSVKLTHAASFDPGDGRCSWSVGGTAQAPSASPGVTIGSFSGSAQACTVEAYYNGPIAQGMSSYNPSVLLSSGASIAYRWQVGPNIDNVGSYCMATIKA